MEIRMSTGGKVAFQRQFKSGDVITLGASGSFTIGPPTSFQEWMASIKARPKSMADHQILKAAFNNLNRGARS